jgi:Zn-dependent M28 family amino/carboxypeptidase
MVSGRRWQAALLGLWSLAACGPATEPTRGATSPAAPTSGPQLAPRDPSAIGRIASDVGYLASPALAGRGTGEPGARAAADFVVARFQELGLRPLGDPAGAGRGFLQAFQARVGVKTEAPRLAVTLPKVAVKPAAKKEAEASSKLDVSGDAIVTADGSASGDVSAEPVFVGYGITAAAVGWDDYAGSDVAGKVVLVLDGVPRAAPTAATPPANPPANPHGAVDPAQALRDFGSVRYKLRTAREHKAAGAILVTQADQLPAVPADASSMGIPAVVIKRSAIARLLAAAKIDDAAVRSAGRATRATPIAGASVTLGTRLTALEAPAWNVVGALPARDGSQHAAEWVVVGAHYDHLGHGGTSASRAPGAREIHPGADDNASGTAMLLEVARRLSRARSRPERNVAFVAFGAEEIGTIGSRHFVDHPPVPMGSVVAMINADMVGRLRMRRLLVDGVGTSPGWPKIVQAAAAGLDLNLTFGNEGFGASDHATFTAARVPVTFLFTGVHDDYHKPTDTADKVSAEGIEIAATLATRLAQLVAERDERLAFADAASDPHRGMRGGFRVSMGTLPDYAFQGKGMRLSGVRPDAPAHRAGMQAGDVIVKVGKHDVGNVHDFMYALAELEPGREVVVEVEREGKRLPLKVVPAPGR